MYSFRLCCSSCQTGRQQRLTMTTIKAARILAVAVRSQADVAAFACASSHTTDSLLLFNASLSSCVCVVRKEDQRAAQPDRSDFELWPVSCPKRIRSTTVASMDSNRWHSTCWWWRCSFSKQPSLKKKKYFSFYYPLMFIFTLLTYCGHSNSSCFCLLSQLTLTRRYWRRRDGQAQVYTHSVLSELQQKKKTKTVTSSL